jgi:hypothetical protein
MRARIYKPPKTAMQSGWAKTKQWVLEYAPAEKRVADPLMGWIGSGDTLSSQVRLGFPTREAAVAYAVKHGIAYDIDAPAERVIRPKAYADNFAFTRVENWTH